MNSSLPTFSIVIIGYNTSKQLQKLLDSIQRIEYPEQKIEIIYIDDGSSDHSMNLFNNYNLQFSKNCYGFSKNQGRVVVTDKGIKLAQNEWILFIQSNMTVSPNILQKYMCAIKSKKEAIAFGGSIQYICNDKKFEKYLNNPRRGIKQYKQYEMIQYQHLLFGNSIIKNAILKTLPLNQSLKHYGGEELDFAYRLSQQYPKKTFACKNAIAKRINHPGLLTHYKRLIELGKYNLPLLNNDLKKIIIKYPIFLSKQNVWKIPIILLNKILLLLYRLKIQSFLIIKLILLTSILRGYYNKVS